MRQHRSRDQSTGDGLMNEEYQHHIRHTHALDVIGPISIGGEYDEEGEVIEPPTLLDGWHVNYVGELPEGWEQYVVRPQQPVRVFAG